MYQSIKLLFLSSNIFIYFDVENDQIIKLFKQ